MNVHVFLAQTYPKHLGISGFDAHVYVFFSLLNAKSILQCTFSEGLCGIGEGCHRLLRGQHDCLYVVRSSETDQLIQQFDATWSEYLRLGLATIIVWVVSETQNMGLFRYGDSDFVDFGYE